MVEWGTDIARWAHSAYHVWNSGRGMSAQSLRLQCTQCGGKSVQWGCVWGCVCAWVHWWNLTQLLCKRATDVTMQLNLAQGPAFSNWRCKLASFPGSPQRKMYTTAQLQCSHSRPEEPGDEARWYSLIPRPHPSSSCFHSWMGRAWEQGYGDPAFPVLYNSSFFFFSAE